MKTCVFILWAMLFSNSIFGQSDVEIYIVSETKPVNEHEVDIFRIKVIYKTLSKVTELLEISNYRADFTFLGSMYEKDGSNLLLFRNFDSVAGGTKYYYIDVKNFVIFSTNWLSEVLLPELFSFDKMNQTIKCISIDYGKCGEIYYYPLIKGDGSKDLKKELTEFIILQKINL